MLDAIFRILPGTVADLISQLPKETIGSLEEIRIRENRPLEIVYGKHFGFVSLEGKVLTSPDKAYHPNRNDCIQLIDLLSNHSLYTLEEELRRGFITVRGGHRVGIAGRVVLERGNIRHIRNITCFNIRIAKEIIDIAVPVLPYLLDPTSESIHQTLIVSPPQQGKTTLARDLARLISYGRIKKVFPWNGLKVAIVDERSELAACVDGIPSFDIGPRTDVLDACPKAEGMMIMIRSMSPDVIVVDEIGSEADAASIHEALYAGIRVIATAHGHTMDDILGKPVLERLVRDQLFSRMIVLGKRSKKNNIVGIFDGSGRPVQLGKPVQGGL